LEKPLGGIPEESALPASLFIPPVGALAVPPKFPLGLTLFAFAGAVPEPDGFEVPLVAWAMASFMVRIKAAVTKVNFKVFLMNPILRKPSATARSDIANLQIILPTANLYC
jgi:hypothetical protein